MARAMFSIILLLLSVGMYFLERYGYNDRPTLTHVGAILVTLAYLWVFLRDSQAVVMTSFFQIYYMLGMMLSAAIISFGTFMIEVGRFGTANGFFWVLLGYLVAGMEATRAGYNLAGRLRFTNGMMRPSDGLNKALIWAFTGVVLLMALYVFLRTGGPILQGVDRVTFWKTLAPAGTKILPSLVTQSFFFAAFYFLWIKRSEKSAGLPILILVSYVLAGIFVLGEKFSLFINFLNAWLFIMPAFFDNVRLTWRSVISGMSIIAVLLTYIAFTYMMKGSNADFVLVRAALQAQLLWSIFDNTDVIAVLPQNSACYLGCGPFQSGRDFISFTYLPTGLFYFYQEGGSTLSGFMPALSIMTMGSLLTLFLHLLISFTLGFVQRKTVITLGSGNLLLGFLSFKIHFAIVVTWYVATFAPLRGLIAAVFLTIVYAVIFPRRKTAPALVPDGNRRAVA
ncbi:hypothetical protein MU516_16405 [Paracoccus sp. YLB-12]|uniref:Oligosaccharide repeat unit polymerase n=1 Tax=Paracoccus maritimus TaxID=2933292 RepID=A0ABT2KD20_9RHOB|nr:hypothetical protein [Paracoccus sp. YLB-12]MCT4334441.1 hypothetical protein [Paracoccus sp. YLB-12]